MATLFNNYGGFNKLLNNHRTVYRLLLNATVMTRKLYMQVIDRSVSWKIPLIVGNVPCNSCEIVFSLLCITLHYIHYG